MNEFINDYLIIHRVCEISFGCELCLYFIGTVDIREIV